MEIKMNLPQFEGRKSLIIVSGEFHALYYLAHNGKIVPLSEFAVTNPRSQSREDYVETTKNGISWPVYNDAKQETQQKLLRRLTKETKEICDENNIEDTYLFCIQFMLKEVKWALSERVKKTLRMEHSWDMRQRHPFELLEIIKEKIGIWGG